VDFYVLGRLQMRSGGSAYTLRRTKPKIVLAVLLAHLDQPVSTDRIMRELWGERPPQSAAANLYTYVCSIRGLLTAGRSKAKILTGAAGYVLNVEDDCLDALRYRRLAADGRAALRDGDLRSGVALLGQAARLWRGRPLADLPSTPEVEQWVEILEEQHRSLLRDWTDARLRLGQNEELVGELRAGVAADPMCERLYVQLMLALYRSGRVAEALEAYRDVRRLLAAELGLEPGPELTSVQGAILRRDPSLATGDLSVWLTGCHG
jgi:DNA-binding SARP family transcriptional activator